MQTKLLKWIFPAAALVVGFMGAEGINALANEPDAKEQVDTCLLYTSDAADE